MFAQLQLFHLVDIHIYHSPCLYLLLTNFGLDRHPKAYSPILNKEYPYFQNLHYRITYLQQINFPDYSIFSISPLFSIKNLKRLLVSVNLSLVLFRQLSSLHRPILTRLVYSYSGHMYFFFNDYSNLKLIELH